MQITPQASLKNLNSFGVTASCRQLVQLDRPEDVERLLQLPGFTEQPYLLLGGGSNLLFTQDFAGTVIAVGLKGIEKIAEDEDAVFLQVAAGESWYGFVLYTLEAGYAGLENLSLIPGSVGAAPIQNIGAYGVELESVFHSLSAIDLESGRRREFTREDAHFGYRDSYFKSGAPFRYLIISVTFRLPKRPQWQLEYGGLARELDGQEITARSISDAVCRLRRSKLPNPSVLGNAGSFFKNPVVSDAQYQSLKQDNPQMPGFAAADGQMKIPAAWLIEQQGWKGKREGDAGVSEDHALVLVNYGKASGAELWQLAQQIRDSVSAAYGITLEPEPRVL